MGEFLQALCARTYLPRQVAMSDDRTVLSGDMLLKRIAGLVEQLQPLPDVVGLIGNSGTELAIGQLASWIAGKTVVPLPIFFSRQQLCHVIRDAGIGHVVSTREAIPIAAELGVCFTEITSRLGEAAPNPKPGAGVIAYTSGSTGQPKGVRLGIAQINWQTRALATAIKATADDRYLSVLPLALLLETITAICVPALTGARTHFASEASKDIGFGRRVKLRPIFEAARPTTSVLVPELLSGWISELETGTRKAPDSLRLVAVGGACVSSKLTERAWQLGIPVHEGYGLTECCSVVAMNRPGSRKAGTVGAPLPGLDVTIEDGEIVVWGPTLMEGYLHGPSAEATWRTGDLGSFDEDGNLTVTGRKDNVLVLPSGRNISPEWIEAMITAHPFAASAIALNSGETGLAVLLIPSALGAAWLMEASQAEILAWLEEVCKDAPRYALPRDFVVCPPRQANHIGILTPNGRPVREIAHGVYPVLKHASQDFAALTRTKERLRVLL